VRAEATATWPILVPPAEFRALHILATATSRGGPIDIAVWGYGRFQVGSGDLATGYPMDPSCSAAAGRRGETSGVGAALPGQAQTTAQ